MVQPTTNNPAQNGAPDEATRKNNVPVGARVDTVTGQALPEETSSSDSEHAPLPLQPVAAGTDDDNQNYFDVNASDHFFILPRNFGSRSPSNYNGLKINPDSVELSPRNPTLSSLGPLKIGTVIIFSGEANHAAMLVGYDKDGKGVWYSDARQRSSDGTVNAATRHALSAGTYTLLDPPEHFNAKAAVDRIMQLSHILTDGSGRAIGVKSDTRYTELCQQHTRMGVEAGLGHGMVHAGTAREAVPTYLAAGFTRHSFTQVAAASHPDHAPLRAAAAAPHPNA